MQLRDAKDDVNLLGGWLEAMIRGAFGVLANSIKGLVSGYDGATSRNWDEVGCAADMIALVHGNPTSHPVPVILGFLDWTLARTDYFRGEGSILTKVYTRHIWPPRLIMYAACIVLSKDDPATGRKADPRFAPYIEPLRLWLRALFGFALPCSQNVRGRSMTQAEILRAPKPGIVVADAPPKDNYPPISGGIVGRRSWDGEFPAGRGWFWGNPVHIACAYLAEFGLGLPMSSPLDVGLAIRQAWKVDTTLTTPEEKARMLAALNDSVPDLDWAVATMCGKYGSADPVSVYRFADSSTSVLEETGGAPTNAIAAWTMWKTGKAEMMSPTSGHRGSSLEGLSAVVDLDARIVTAKGAKNGNVVKLQMSKAPQLWGWRWPGGGAQGQRIFPAGGGTPQPQPTPTPGPTPQPTPEPPSGDRADAFDWLVNADANLAAVGPNGFYGNICAVAGFPHLFICRQAGGEVPWGALLLWRDEHGEQIRLVAETGYRVETGEVGNVRTFWGADGRPGVVWLPRWIDRNAPMRYETRGALVDHALLDGHGPYRPDGSRLAPGEYQEDKLVASTELVHVGVTDQLGEPVAVVRRTDTMGAEPANVEEYEVGFGRGAYGFVRWQSWERREHKRHDWADRIVDAGVPCRVYGFDPLDPECRERWFAAPGYVKPLPAAGEPTRRPSVAPSTPTKGGGRSSRGCLVYWLTVLAAGAALAAIF